MQKVDHRLFGNPNNSGFLNCCRGGYTHVLPCETGFPEETPRLQDRNHRLFSLLGDDGQLNLTLLDIEHGIRRISLREHDLVLEGSEERFSIANF